MIHRHACIVRCAAITPLGDLDSTWNALMHGKSALRRMNPGEETAFSFNGLAGVVDGLTEMPGIYARLHRLLALLYEQMSDMMPLPAETGLVLATTKGAVDELVPDADHADMSMPGQPWNLADHIARSLGISGQRFTISAACASGAVAVIQGAMRIMSGETRAVLVIGIDVLSRFVLNGFTCLHALSRSACRPFDRRRDGLVLGEGAAAVLLIDDETVKEYAAEGNAVRLSGWGIACDAAHITAPARDAAGLISAIMTATRNGSCPVGAVNAHGTATVYNDAMEMTAFRAVWGEKTHPPFHSVKGSTGHCLGAAGVIEVCLASMSLKAGMIPPTAGLEEPEAGYINVDGTGALPIAWPSILSCNSGFGGINAAVLMDFVDI